LSKQTTSTSLEKSDSKVVTRKNIYRKISVLLAFVAAGISLAALPLGYFLLVPLVDISVLLFVSGGVLIWNEKAITGAVLVLLGGLFGGLFALPWLLWRLLAIPLDDLAYSLPLLPIGLLIPLISVVLAFMSRESRKPGYHQDSNC
jgi:hypothetical protein